MRIISNPQQGREVTHKCNQCYCIFAFTLSEAKTLGYTHMDGSYATITCPNCGSQETAYYNFENYVGPG